MPKQSAVEETLRAVLTPLLPPGVVITHVTSHGAARLEDVNDESPLGGIPTEVSASAWSEGEDGGAAADAAAPEASSADAAPTRSLAAYLAELSADDGDDGDGDGVVALFDHQSLDWPGVDAYRAPPQDAAALRPDAAAARLRAFAPAVARPSRATPDAMKRALELAARSTCSGVVAALVAPSPGPDDASKFFLLAVSAAPPSRVDLRALLRHSPRALDLESSRQLVCYQLARELARAHASGFALAPHGGLDARDAWVEGAPRSPIVRVAAARSSFRCSSSSCSDADAVREATIAWRAGVLSNLDYLLELNARAGRTRGDRAFHAVVPWVVDFVNDPDEATDEARTSSSSSSSSTSTSTSSPLGRWRDLTKTKWRLCKGDAQLDHAFEHSDHHVSDDCLSELAVCVYKSRVLPLSVLRRTVRMNFVADEYPRTIARVFEWSPDECVPEFYDDASVFKSAHPEDVGLRDLEVPSGCDSPEDFVAKHRAALESDVVSRGLPAWIDLTFGVALRGEDAIRAKNVMVEPADVTAPRGFGRVALFRTPHPARGLAAPRLLVPDRSPSPPRSSIDADEDPTRRASHSSLLGDDRIPLLTIAPADVLEALDPPPPPPPATERETRARTLRDAAREDVRALGRVFAAVYARDVAVLDMPITEVEKSVVPSLPLVVRATVASMTSTRASGGAPTAAAVRDSTLFPRRIRVAADALATIRAARAGIPRATAAAAALRNGAATCGVEAAELIAPAASRAVADAPSPVGAVAGEILSLVARRAPAEVSTTLLAPCIADVLALGSVGGGGGGGGRGETADDADAEEDAADAARASALADDVLRPVQRALGAASFRLEVVPLLVRCVVSRAASARVGAAACAALASLASREPLPVALRVIVRPLLKATSRRPSKTDGGGGGGGGGGGPAPDSASERAAVALTSIAEALGPSVTARHVLPALVATVFKPTRGGGDVDDVAMTLYASLGDVVGLGRLRDVVRDASAVEASLISERRWKPSREALAAGTPWEQREDAAASGAAQHGSGGDRFGGLVGRGLNGLRDRLMEGWQGLGDSSDRVATAAAAAAAAAPARDDADADADADDEYDDAHDARAPWGWLPRVGYSPADDSEAPWELRLETLTSWRAHRERCAFVAASDDESYLLTGGGDGVVRVWSTGGTTSGGPIASHDTHGPFTPTCATFLGGAKVRSIHWSPHDRVGVVNADP